MVFDNEVPVASSASSLWQSVGLVRPNAQLYVEWLQFGCLVICLVVCVVCGQVNNGVLRLYYRIARWSRVHWNAKNLLVVGEEACRVKKKTAFHAVSWCSSTRSLHSNDVGWTVKRPHMSRRQAGTMWDGLTLAKAFAWNSFPLPILSPNPMVHPVVQHDFHCCQFKAVIRIIPYISLCAVELSCQRCWRMLEDVVAVGEAAHFAAQRFIATCFNGSYLCNMLQRSLRNTGPGRDFQLRAERPQLDLEIGWMVSEQSHIMKFDAWMNYDGFWYLTVFNTFLDRFWVSGFYVSSCF